MFSLLAPYSKHLWAALGSKWNRNLPRTLRGQPSEPPSSTAFGGLNRSYPAGKTDAEWRCGFSPLADPQGLESERNESSRMPEKQRAQALKATKAASLLGRCPAGEGLAEVEFRPTPPFSRCIYSQRRVFTVLLGQCYFSPLLTKLTQWPA